MIFLFAAPSFASSGHVSPRAVAPDDGGLVFVNGINFEDIPQDQVVDCGTPFTIEFYNFDEGERPATVQFTSLTEGADVTATGNLHPEIGEDPPGGPTDLDARETYTVAFTGEPDPETNAFHVRLRVFAPGTVGSNGESRRFLVTCGAPTTPPTTTPTTTPPTSTSPTVSTQPPTSPPTSAPHTTAPSPPVPVPTEIDSGLTTEAGTSSDGSAGVSRWGVAGSLLGLGLVCGGFATIVRSRRRG